MGVITESGQRKLLAPFVGRALYLGLLGPRTEYVCVRRGGLLGWLGLTKMMPRLVTVEPVDCPGYNRRPFEWAFARSKGRLVVRNTGLIHFLPGGAMGKLTHCAVYEQKTGGKPIIQGNLNLSRFGAPLIPWVHLYGCQILFAVGDFEFELQ